MVTETFTRIYQSRAVNENHLLSNTCITISLRSYESIIFQKWRLYFLSRNLRPNVFKNIGFLTVTEENLFPIFWMLNIYVKLKITPCCQWAERIQQEFYPCIYNGKFSWSYGKTCFQIKKSFILYPKKWGPIFWKNMDWYEHGQVIFRE